MELIQQFDATVLFFIRDRLHADWLNPVMISVSFLANWGIIWIAVAAALLCLRKYRKTGAELILALVFCLVAMSCLKAFFLRDRPFIDYPQAALLIPPPRSASFPSGHAMSSFASASVLFSANRKAGAAAFALAALIAFSRLYLFVHYPTDVLAGIVLGLAAAKSAGYLVKRFSRTPFGKRKTRQGE